MRIVVDEMPKKAEECLFVRYDDFDCRCCGLRGGGCYLANGDRDCRYLVERDKVDDKEK